ELAQALGQLLLAPHELGLAAGGRLGEAVRAGPQHARQRVAEGLAERGGELTRLQLAARRHDPDLQLAAATAFTHDEVAQARAPIRCRARALIVTMTAPAALAPARLTVRPRRARLDGCRTAAIPRGKA